MATPNEFDPLQPPPVQPPAAEPQELEYGNFAPPPQEEQGRPTTVYMPQHPMPGRPVAKPSSPLAFLIGFLASLVLGVAGMFPMIPADAGKKPGEEERRVQIAGRERGLGERGKLLFSGLGADYEMRFDPLNWFMWAAMAMGLVNLWLTLIRSYAGYWIISLGTLATVAILYVMHLLPLKVLPGTGLWALALGSVILLLAAILGTRAARAAKRARYQY